MSRINFLLNSDSTFLFGSITSKILLTCEACWFDIFWGFLPPSAVWSQLAKSPKTPLPSLVSKLLVLSPSLSDSLSDLPSEAQLLVSLMPSLLSDPCLLLMSPLSSLPLSMTSLSLLLCLRSLCSALSSLFETRVDRQGFFFPTRFLQYSFVFGGAFPNPNFFV